MTRGEFVEKVYQIAEKYDGSVTSGLRSKARNKKVGGKPNSRHISGYALDVVLDCQMNSADFFTECRAEGFGVVDEGDHIHVQTKGSIGRVV